MTSKKPGRNRVEAWIYGVINPLEEAVEIEALAGLRRDPTFRSRGVGLENLLRFRKYLTRSGALILDDLSTYHPPIKETEKRHDELIAELEWEANSLFKRLSANPDFQTFVEQNFKDVCAPDSMLREVTENLINDTAESVDPNEGSFSEAWNRSLPSLKKFRKEAGYQALESKLAELREHSENIRGELMRLRAQLVEISMSLRRRSTHDWWMAGGHTADGGMVSLRFERRSQRGPDRGTRDPAPQRPEFKNTPRCF